MRSKLWILLVFLVLFTGSVSAQGFFSRQNQNEEGEEQVEGQRRGPTAILLPRKLIDIPTANMLPRGSFDFDFRVYPKGGIFAAVDIGLTHWFMLGAAYGGENILGEGGVNWNPRAEFLGRIRIIQETYALPSVALGFDSQGSGAFNDSLKRYTIKSKGFYAAVSKNYLWGAVPIGFHGGINYSLETKDGDENPSLFIGTDIMFNDQVVLEVSYDFALNDNRKGSYFGRGRGYFDTALRWLYSETLQMEFQLKNLLQNRKGSTTISREFRVIYIEFF
ncbi:hypothetical protein A2W24_00505 [Microgenomates group bacterium RBG_16_45_19]|nr:MAG: hypothetical protein A2W24_00505 [Microgenomates group bacterium RBG_16_45_19]